MNRSILLSPQITLGPYRVLISRTAQYSRNALPATRFYTSSAERKQENESKGDKPNFFQRYKFNPSNIPDSPEFGTNQYISIDEEVKQRLKNVLNSFNAPIRYSFAYGSGVFQQKGYDSKVNSSA
jgi:translocator assembly and maintenance protein 41